MFFKKKISCPIPDWDQQWMEDAFKWMIIEFGIDKIKSKKVLLPTKDDFPFDIVPSEQTAHYFLEKIALQMDIDYNKIKLIFFDEEQHIIGDNSIQPISIISESNTNYAGAYYGSNESGEYVISLNKAQMNYPENIIATIAHELSHIKNYDIRFSTIVAIFIGFIVILSDMVTRATFFGGGFRNRDSRENNNQLGALLAIVSFILLILSPLIAQLIQLAISRQREYLADSSGALLTRYPEGLARALEKISHGPSLRTASNATAHLFIANPFRSKSISGLLSTHPPIEERIKRLRTM